MADLQGQIRLQDSSEGEVSGPAKNLQSDPTAPNTLDEPVSTTILRDLKRIAFKLKYVMMPKVREEKARELRDWDLWGPLLLCMLLSLTLSLSNSGGSTEDTASFVFSIVFCLISIGSVIITVNTLLLGGQISFFQSVCVLGYCLFPMNISALFVCIFKTMPIVFKLIIVAAGFSWATLCSVGFMA
jgi:hypothetical protein